jgi:hypothetical protein
VPDFDIGTTHPPQPPVPPAAQPRNRGPRSKTTGVAAAQPSSSAPAGIPLSPSSADLGPSTAPDMDMSQVDEHEYAGALLLRKSQEKAKLRMRSHKNMSLSQPMPGSPDPTQDTIPPTSQAIHYQERKAWSLPEEQRLIDLIAAHGPAYSKILKADADEVEPRLQSRGQVQLKDKARNIKFAYLKAGDQLPDGFGAVSIGKKMVEKLREKNIYVEVSSSIEVMGPS